MELTCDMREVCESHISKETAEYLIDFADRSENDEVKAFIFNLLNKEYSFSSDHYYNIPLDVLREGDILLADVSALTSFGSKWAHIKIDHIYRNFIFYTILDGDSKGQEGFCQTGSLFFSKQIYPCYIVVPRGYSVKCDCPLTRVIDESPDLTPDCSLYDAAGDCRTYKYVVRTEYDY